MELTLQQSQSFSAETPAVFGLAHLRYQAILYAAFESTLSHRDVLTTGIGVLNAGR